MGTRATVRAMPNPRMLPVAALALLLLAGPALAQPTPQPLRYGLVLLKSGVRPDISKAESDSLQAGHMANIIRMANEGALLAAGPMGDGSDLRGIFLFKPDSIAELDRLVAPDPIIAAGRLVCEPHIWIADAGIGADYWRRRAEDPAQRDSMVRYSMVLLRRGPRWTANVTHELRDVLARQKQEIERQRASHQLAVAGGIEGMEDLRGVYVYDADTLQARALIERDPAVKSGRLIAEIHPWWTAYGIIPRH
jgi:hypothetical protein